ncbi:MULTISPECIES: hypothetical protein [unclassified Streptomyces]|uniref:hypothetical protein n=1 Tax=unclassified Streptomyces TaxID=2593676 RepID=UPI0037183E78
MPLPLSDLRTLLTSGTDLNLSPDRLQLENAGRLFRQFLKDGQLLVTNTSVDLEALIVEGKIQIFGQDPSDAHIAFLADDAEEYLVGIRVDVVLLSGGPGLPSGIAHIPDALAPLDRGPLHLVFGIDPDGSPRVGLGVELLFPAPESHPHPYLWAYPPRDQTQPWKFFGMFKDVRLDGGIGKLKEICDADYVLPDGVKADGLTLNALTLDVIPDHDAIATGKTSRWLSLGMGLKLAGRWNVWPDVLEVTELNGSFVVTDPQGQRGLFTIIGGRVRLTHDIEVDVTVTLPGKSLQGSMAGTLKVGELLDKMFGKVPLLEELSVSGLTVAAELGSERGYFLDLELENLPVTDGLKLSKVGLRVQKEAGEISATIGADWQAGKKTLSVAGILSLAEGWVFTASSPTPGVTLTEIFSGFTTDIPEALRGIDPYLTALEIAYQPTGKSLTIQAKADRLALAFVSLPSA